MRRWVLGAPDPEMSAIDALIRQAGETVARFLAGDWPAGELVDLYGDPARGFAGGYRR